MQALVRLGRNRSEVEITVLQEPSRGTRGIGSHEARVRVFVRPGGAARSAPGDEPEELDDAELDGVDEYAPDVYDEETYAEEEVEYEPIDIPTGPLKDLLPPDASIEEVAVEALRAILAHMGVRALVEVKEPLSQSEEEAEEEPLTLNIRSDDSQTLSLLIGRRGETLGALQLLVNLVVNKQTGVREHIIVDAERYRERREFNLRAMAARIADQVRRSGRQSCSKPCRRTSAASSTWRWPRPTTSPPRAPARATSAVSSSPSNAPPTPDPKPKALVAA